MTDLTGKVAFVTGGSRGIGRAICSALAQAGASISYTYRSNETEAAQAANDLRRLTDNVSVFRADVNDRAAMERALLETEKNFGGIDILVNNAGINKPTDFDKISDQDWDEILAVNLKGPFVCSQLTVPFMRRRGGGSIINIGSVSGQYGGPRTAHYAASKAGLISLGQVIARFGAKDKIRCNTVAAGLIASEMAQGAMNNQAVAKAAEAILMQRMGTPQEVGKVVVFLASDSSSYITAQTLNVNGGLYF